jgi:hypothetical protein
VSSIERSPSCGLAHLGKNSACARRLLSDNPGDRRASSIFNAGGAKFFYVFPGILIESKQTAPVTGDLLTRTGQTLLADGFRPESG